MTKNKKTTILLIVILILAFSPVFIIKYFNLNDKIKAENSKDEKKAFDIFSEIMNLNEENKKLLMIFVEVSIISGLIGFFIGYFLVKIKKQRDVGTNEVICPACKEKFLRKTFKPKDQ